MILFDLICTQGHGFEAWFRDSASFERLAAVGEIQCAVCGDTAVRKALMAPNISTTRARTDESSREAGPRGGDVDGDLVPSSDRDASAGTPANSGTGSIAVQDNRATFGRPPLSGSQGLPVPEKIAEAMQILRKVQTHIEKTFDHVGDRFAEEARKMHYGETEKRSIYGQATQDEAEELADEGIDVNRMPWLTPRNS
jgi:hypothetical protein